MPSTLTWKSLWRRLVFVVRAWNTSRRGVRLCWCQGCGAMLTHTPTYQVACDDCLEEAERSVQRQAETQRTIQSDFYAAAFQEQARNAARYQGSLNDPYYIALMQGMSQDQARAQFGGPLGQAAAPFGSSFGGLGGLLNNPFWRS